MYRVVEHSYCPPEDTTKHGRVLPACPDHPGRPQVKVRYVMFPYETEAWADTEEAADAVARHDMEELVRSLAKELRDDADALEEQMLSVETLETTPIP